LEDLVRGLEQRFLLLSHLLRKCSLGLRAEDAEPRKEERDDHRRHGPFADLVVRQRGRGAESREQHVRHREARNRFRNECRKELGELRAALVVKSESNESQVDQQVEQGGRDDQVDSIRSAPLREQRERQSGGAYREHLLAAVEERSVQRDLAPYLTEIEGRDPPDGHRHPRLVAEQDREGQVDRERHGHLGPVTERDRKQVDGGEESDPEEPRGQGRGVAARRRQLPPEDGSARHDYGPGVRAAPVH
jgi:hypothetical protein